jgi:hypothetical protein
MTRCTPTRLWCGFSLVLLASLPATAAGPESRTAAGAAQRVDEALARALGPNAALPPVTDDETFLRRVSLDLTGQPPAAADAAAFACDSRADRRARHIDRLLAGQAHAVNWGRYWRDVLTYHTPASGNYLRWQSFDGWMVEQLRRNRPWNEIVTALVTATGINDECPPVNFLTALYGNQVEIASTVSRVFLGVQIQCAQCHNARSEPWKREQFHEFAAFFGRMKIIQHKDVTGRGTPYAIEGREDGQYQMADKKDPSRLLAMTPRFLTGQAVSLEAGDGERRAALARFLTSPDNPWFAKAHVNRIWTSLLGWGFYPGLADLGGSMQPQFPEALDLLAREWTASGYDMRWLFRTVTLTQTYQRQLQPRPAPGSPAPLAVCPQRLRPEQVFDALVRALGFDENDKTIPAPAPSSAPAVARHTGLRHMVYQAFRADPSLPPDEVQGTIPQVLLLMNSALVNTWTVAKGRTFLAEALAQNRSDDEIVGALYQRTLSRKPKPEEMDICRNYIKKRGNRAEALEDIFWGLVNSTEFVTRR